jgi:hypothetical protein
MVAVLRGRFVQLRDVIVSTCGHASASRNRPQLAEPLRRFDDINAQS